MKKTTPALIPARVDMAKVAKAVAELGHVPGVRRANAYHDLPPVDAHRRRPINKLHRDHCSGFNDPNFFH